MYSILLLLALNPPSQPTVDVVDRVEINHFYNDDGNLVFHQLILWNWSHHDDRFEVVDWRILRGVRRCDPLKKAQWKAEHPDGPPYVPEWIGGHATPHKERCGYVSEWYDEKSRKNRRVVATTFIETWTDVDREIVNREYLPPHKRRNLR